MKADPASPSAASFWRFSLAVYGKPGVSGACLDLQDAHEVDVNVLLYCCWMAHRGCSLTTAQCLEAIKTTEEWRRDVVQPLRAIRRHVGAGDRTVPAFASAYTALKTCELQIEQTEQAMLAAAAPTAPSLPQLAGNVAAALGTFAAAQGIAGAAGVEAALARIADAVETVQTPFNSD